MNQTLFTDWFIINIINHTNMTTLSNLKKINNDKTKALALLSAIGCDDYLLGVGDASEIEEISSTSKKDKKYWNFESEKLSPLKNFLIENLSS